MSKELAIISKTKSLSKESIGEFFGYLSQKDPRDLAISIISEGVPDKLKDLAKSHLDTCAECAKFVSSDGNFAVIKVQTNKDVYNEDDPDIIKATAAVAKAEESVKKAKDKLKAVLSKKRPTHSVTSHYYKKSNA